MMRRAPTNVVAVAVTDSGRPFPRIGGLTVGEIKEKMDSLDHVCHSTFA